MNSKKIMPFIIWLILKLRQVEWEVLKSEVDQAFGKINKEDVIPADQQDDISQKIIDRL